jgi:hypothetical protein
MTEVTLQPYGAEHVLKRRASVQRDVARILDELAPERPPARHDAPTPTIRRHRSPGRCILQGAWRAVSVSWFPGLAGDDSMGELVVIVWRGTVSLPGSANRARTAAEPMETLVLRPVGSASGAWAWHSQGDASQYAADAVAAHCLTLLGE